MRATLTVELPANKAQWLTAVQRATEATINAMAADGWGFERSYNLDLPAEFKIED